MHIRRQAKDRHDLRRDRDHKVILADHSVHLISKSHNDVAEHSVVHVQTSLPDDLSWIDLQLVSLLDMIVQDRRQQIVRRSDCMEISRKMEVQILHRHYLRITASRSAAFDAKARAKRRLTERYDRLLSKFAKGLSKTDACCRLPFPGRRRVDGRHQDQLSIFPLADALYILIRYFRLVSAVELQLIFGDPQLFCDLGYVLHNRFLCDFNICLHLCLHLSLYVFFYELFKLFRAHQYLSGFRSLFFSDNARFAELIHDPRRTVEADLKYTL